jgi:hypothetical protein
MTYNEAQLLMHKYQSMRERAANGSFMDKALLQEWLDHNRGAVREAMGVIDTYKVTHAHAPQHPIQEYQPEVVNRGPDWQPMITPQDDQVVTEIPPPAERSIMFGDDE